MTWREYKDWFFKTYGSQENLGGGLGNGCGPTLMIYVFVGFVIVATCLMSCNQCSRTTITSDTVRIERVDTIWKTDTMPVVKTERIVKYVKVPVPIESSDTAAGKPDSLTLPVVQREYADSNYTAWVSGVAVDSFPRLDSISVKERIVTRETTITNTIVERKKPSRWSVGLTGGYGLGLQSQRIEPFVGVGVTYRIFPP